MEATVNDAGEFQAKLNYELLQQVFRNEKFVAAVLPLLMVVVMLILWGKVPQSYLLSWLAFCGVMELLLIGLIIGYSRASPVEQAAPSWAPRVMVLAFIEELSWGMLCPISFMAENPIYQFFVLFILGGRIMGGASTRGIHFPVYVAATVPMMSVVLLTLAQYPDQLHRSMLFLSFIFFAYMLLVARKYSFQFRNSLIHWLTNEQLVEELQRSQRELIQTKWEIEEVSEAKSRFLAHMSHDLRTPLNGIMGFAALLDESEPDDEQRHLYVTNINRCAATLQRMANEILALSSIESGKLVLLHEAFEFDKEIGDVVASLEMMAKRKGLDFHYIRDERLPNRLCGDVFRIQQVVYNLVENAIKYTEQGEIRFTVGLSEENSERLRVEVSDTGIGICDEFKEKLFAAFTQGNVAGKRYSGVGLGLSIVKQLVDAMGGRVGFDAERRQGSLLWFELPLQMAG